jgi:acyl-homoserine lactone acylase PvdQ
MIPSYFKDATFGVKVRGVPLVESPRSDVTIEHDKEFGVPHIYASTRVGLMFGAGYAGAEERLFLMDVLRHTTSHKRQCRLIINKSNRRSMFGSTDLLD